MCIKGILEISYLGCHVSPLPFSILLPSLAKYVQITDSKTPIRPIKVPDEYLDQPEQPAQPSETSGIVFDLGDCPMPPTRSGPGSAATTTDGNVQLTSKPRFAKLHVLVAEDDPINMKILRKRLEKAGHIVYHAVNGEDCAAAYRETSGQFDVVLMDMQVRLFS